MRARLHCHRLCPATSLLPNPRTPASTFSSSLLLSTDGRPAAAAAPSSRFSLCLRRGRTIDAFRLRLRSHDPSTAFPLSAFSPVDSFVAVHALRSAPSPDAALSLFRSLQSDPSFSHTHHTLHALAKTLSLSRRPRDLRSLLESADAGAFPRVPPPSPMDRLRWYAAAGDLPSALRAWEGVRAATGNRRHPCTESYNLVMSLYAAAGVDAEAVEVFRKMVEEGANPNSRTYTVIVEHLVGAGKLETALQVFDRLESMRVRRTSKQYNVLAEAFSSAGSFDGVRRLLVEMQSDGIWPGRAVRAAVARMREAGHYLEETEELAREMLSPDERIGYVVGSGDGDASDDDDDGDGGADDAGRGGERREEIRLKPWLDPNALASALGDWEPREVSALEEAKLVWTPRLVCKFLRGFKKADTAWRFFCWVGHQPGGFTHDRLTVSRMIAILARDGHAELVDRLLSKARADGVTLPFGTIRLVVDFFGMAKRAEAAMRVFRDADAVCGPLPASHRRLLCSSLLRTLAKCRRGDEIMELLEEMMLAGVLPDTQTFSGLMQFYAAEGDLRRVQELSGMVRQCGLHPDAFMCQTLIRAYLKRQRSALALRVFEDMRNSDLAPDGATKALLVKSLWNEGKLREAAYVEERCEEVREGLPLALPGHVWTVSSADLRWIYGIYHGSLAGGNT
uniref:Pentatricopeptide repeat-containing protein At5g66631 n=1 Tax=Anthurium amnicola TaxID=1678845 RepID=A0A1D1YWU3_9ARAE